MKASRGSSLRKKLWQLPSTACSLTWDTFTGFLSFAGTSNQLVSATCKVIICDFDVSTLWVTTSRKHNITETVHFMAPGVDAYEAIVHKSE
ncbi:hypothetical protein ARMGADRAFT_483478 [Armillaria gallica]|uniref:Uncharacterized protein n=1 Tax=Armillaria gallica TaxID=47427 RepID=A0A2H3DYF6_ARMGA|nr:hypothetical protein ARMGADRAFT_483478 [Armillaria gallica]